MRLLILKKAKIISYNNFEEAQVKRAKKDAAKKAKGKGKCGRKRQSATPEADTTTPVKTKPSGNLIEVCIIFF